MYCFYINICHIKISNLIKYKKRVKYKIRYRDIFLFSGPVFRDLKKCWILKPGMMSRLHQCPI